jgi:multiple sugar transport system permease protein
MAEGSTAIQSGVSGQAAGRSRKSRRFWQNVEGYAYVMPALIILLIFQFFPIIYAFVLSLHRVFIFRGFLPSPATEVGFKNYTNLLTDPTFWQAFANTVWYAVGTVTLGLGIALALALLLSRPIKGIGVYRTLYFLPYITSLVVSGIVWQWLFRAPDGRGPGGLINYFLSFFGRNTSDFLGESRGIFKLAVQGIFGSGVNVPPLLEGPSLALCVIILLAVWYIVGFNVVVFMAGLGNIPKELYDAARVDGAEGWKLFRYITWPLLTPTTFFLLVVSTIGAFQAFTPIYVTAMPPPGSGAPAGTTLTLTIMFYNAAFKYSNQGLGYSSTIAMVLFVLLIALAIFQLRFIGRRVQDQA